MTNTHNSTSLGLPSWTIMLSVISILAMSTSVHAAAPSIKEALETCAQQTNSLQRLVCYDRLSAQLNDYDDYSPATVIALQTPPTAPHLPSAVMPVAVLSAPANTETDSVASFGQKVATEDSMVATIVAVKTGSNNLMTITLNNGQVWQQTKSED
ncbi:MAG: hypothetical protein HON44_01450, partial [Glaciecola sp.]|nr:hypothetical protein [Glaciecola sp.]